MAFVALVYGPHQYKARALRDGVFGDNNVAEYMAQNFPAPVERISKGINFPALVLDYPLRESYNELYFHSNDYTFIRITQNEAGFFAGIAAFWFWLGRKLDQSQGKSARTTRPRKVRTAGLACGLAFGILTGIYALQMTASRFHPERQIGAFGIVWAFALIAYFAWQFKREFRPVS